MPPKPEVSPYYFITLSPCHAFRKGICMQECCSVCKVVVSCFKTWYDGLEFSHTSRQAKNTITILACFAAEVHQPFAERYYLNTTSMLSVSMMHSFFVNADLSTHPKSIFSCRNDGMNTSSDLLSMVHLSVWPSKSNMSEDAAVEYSQSRSPTSHTSLFTEIWYLPV